MRIKLVTQVLLENLSLRDQQLLFVQLQVQQLFLLELIFWIISIFSKGKINSIKSKARKTKPRPPFTTSSLQQDASSRLRLSPSRTMSLAQQLFQGLDLGNGEEGLITYMRTDSNVLSEDSLSQVGSFIKTNYGDDYYNIRKYLQINLTYRF